MKDDGQKQGQPDGVLTEMGRYAHFGFQLAFSTGLFLLVGWWLDGKWGTTPLLTVIGALMGAGAGFYSMIHHLLIKPGRTGKGSEDQE